MSNVFKITEDTPDAIYCLPFPPTLNTYRTVARGRLITSTKGRQYKKLALKLIKVRETLGGDLSVVIELFPPDRRRRDIDNYLKAALDVLTEAGAWNDDSQVKSLLAVMNEKSAESYIKISVWRD